MIKLLRGDDAKHLITLDLPEVAFSEGITVIFEIGGLKITAPAAPSIEVQFPSTWTALQPCGRILGSWKIRDRNGNIGTLTKTFPVYLTDDVGEITSGSIVSGTVKPVVDFSDIAELTTSATPGDVKAALNEILRRLKTGLNCLLIALAIPAFSAELTPDTIMDKVPGYATISNVVAAAGVTIDGNAGTDGEAVTNIVDRMIVFKRDLYDLSFGGDYCWEITEGEDVTIAPYQIDNNYYFKGNFALHKWYKVVEIYDEKTKQYKVIFSTLRMTPTSPPGITKEITSAAPITNFEFDTIKGVKKRFESDYIALKSEIPTEEKVKETVVQTVREANGGVWDAKLEVWWTPKMENGKLTYQATTNVNINAEN